MIIAVIGAQNTGKTTFIRDFLKAFPHFTSPALDYRDIIKKHGIKLNREGDCRSQRIIMNFIVDDLHKQHESGKDVIIDRSVIDCYVYTLWLYRNNKCSFGNREVVSFFSDMNYNIDYYDMIIHFPIAKTPDMVIEYDGFRDTDQQYRVDIDRLFDEVIQYALPTDMLHRLHRLGGTREERIEAVRPLIPVPACV